MKKKFHKDTFEKIPAEKQAKILIVAAKEFASKGFVNAKVGDIAKKAKISHGSMYTYFSSKDDMIHAIIQKGCEIQRNTFTGSEPEGDIFTKIETILSVSMAFARANPEAITIWLEMSFEYNSRFSRQTLEIEEEGIKAWQDIIEEGKKEGSIDKNIDPLYTAFCIDSMLSILMKGYVSKHEKARREMHFNKEAGDDAAILKGVMTVVRKLLG
ncbi:MAG: TetR/AcrR family transcriptional regulator [bacterium]|nr:TetR/AcrR family transcriptional regulator [bacterium]